MPVMLSLLSLLFAGRHVSFSVTFCTLAATKFASDLLYLVNRTIITHNAPRILHPQPKMERTYIMIKPE
jgi:hypothetical protein